MSAYTSITDIACSKVPILGNLIAAHFKNSKLIRDVTSPSFFVHGKSDTLIPYQHSEKLHAKCNGSYKKLILHNDMTHNDFDYNDDII